MTTFTPSDALLQDRGLERRRDPHEVGLRSWSDMDIDVLVQPRTLLHFSGDARYEWQHAIRAGLEVPLGDERVVCDWWGANDYLLRREPRRFSVVLAFGDA